MTATTWSEFQKIGGDIEFEEILMSSQHSHRHNSWDEAEGKLIALGYLEDDWDELGGRAPSLELVTSALDLLKDLRESNADFPPNLVVAGPMGEIILEWRKDNELTEIEIDSPGFAEITRVKEGVPYEEWTYEYGESVERGGSWASPVTDEIFEAA